MSIQSACDGCGATEDGMPPEDWHYLRLRKEWPEGSPDHGTLVTLAEWLLCPQCASRVERATDLFDSAVNEGTWLP